MCGNVSVDDFDVFFKTQVVLERVLGLTVANNAALDCDPVSGNIAYLAGYVVWFSLCSSNQLR